MVFAFGAGLMTLVRPHAVHSMFGDRSAGRLNGRVGSQQQPARATVRLPSRAGSVGCATVFTVIGGAFAAIAVAAARQR